MYLLSIYLRCKFASASFDGDYFIKKVPAAMFEKLEIDGELQDWYSIQWDPAHRLELAVKQSLGTRSQSSQLSWIQTEVHAVINEINEQRTHGLRYEELMRSDDARVPLLLSSHRFASYGHRALRNFVSNYSTIYLDLKDREDTNLNKINTVPFVLGLNFSTDLYKLISTASQLSQKVEMLPWRQKQAMDTILAKLADVKGKLEEGSPLPDDDFPYYNGALKELQDTRTFKEMPVIIARQPAHRTRNAPDSTRVATMEDAEKLVKKNACSMISIIVEDMGTRGANVSCSHLHHVVRKSFELEEVLQHAQDGTIPPEFLQYAELAIKVSYLDEVSRQDLQRQYTEFCNYISSERSQYESQPVESIEYKLYCKLINSEMHADISDTLHLLAGAMLRTANEAPAESMGNIIKYHFFRRNVNFEAAAQEAFLHWNGPSSIHADGLIRDALNLHFGRDSWHFHRSSFAGRLTAWRISAVVDRKQKEELEKTRIFCQ